MHQSSQAVPIHIPGRNSREFALVLIPIWDFIIALGPGIFLPLGHPQNVWYPCDLGLACGGERKHDVGLLSISSPVYHILIKWNNSISFTIHENFSSVMARGWGVCLLFCSHPGVVDPLICPNPGEFTILLKKKNNAWGWIGTGGNGD